MLETPQIVKTATQPAAAIRITVPREDIQKVMGPGHTELMETLAAQGVTPAGPWFTRHFKMDPKVFDFEIGVPVAGTVSPTGRVHMSQLPAATVARAVYRGPYEGLASAWGEFAEWIDAQGHTQTPELWEVYVAGPESGSDPTEFRTELNRPLTKQR